MIMKINNNSHWHAIVALLLIGALAVSLMSSLALAASQSGGGSQANAGGGSVGSGSSGGGSHPGNAGGGSTGSGGCRVINGPTKFVAISETTETQTVKVGSENSNRPGNIYLVQERTVTYGEYQMTVYTSCTCGNTHQTETSESTVVVGTDTRYSSWRTVSIVRK
jgi:hypothetical protein